MQTLLDNPLVQSALLPLATALVLAGLAAVLAPRWYGLALPASFYPAAFLIAGLQLLPLTSTRKILVLGIVAVVIASVNARYLAAGYRRYLLPLVLISVAVGWVLWPLLSRGTAWMPVGAAWVYLLCLVWLLDNPRCRPTTQLLAFVVLAGTVAVAATIGASALLGQLAGAMAAAAGGLLAVLLVLQLFRRALVHDLLLLPALLMTGLFGVAAVAYANLNWQSLVCALLIPVIIRIPLRSNGTWSMLLLQFLLMLPAVGGAIYLAWGNAGDSYY